MMGGRYVWIVVLLCCCWVISNYILGVDIKRNVCYNVRVDRAVVAMMSKPLCGDRLQ